jgi:DNA invertase Pin-like site-specific DNA recombinase
MNAAIYCRVSTEDQEKEGSSLSPSMTICSAKALDMGYTVG